MAPLSSLGTELRRRNFAHLAAPFSIIGPQVKLNRLQGIGCLSLVNFAVKPEKKQPVNLETKDSRSVFAPTSAKGNGVNLMLKEEKKSVCIVTRDINRPYWLLDFKNTVLTNAGVRQHRAKELGVCAKS